MCVVSVGLWLCTFWFLLTTKTTTCSEVQNNICQKLHAGPWANIVCNSLNKGKSSEFKSSAFTDSFTHINMTFHGTAIIYCLIPILLAFSLYCWPSPYTVGLLPILLAFSLYLCMTLYIVFPQTYRRSITAHTCTGLATQQNS